MSAKRVLIVYAHQEPRSFNGALKDEAVRTLKENGCEVEVSDLYAMQFDPTASRHHFTGVQRYLGCITLLQLKLFRNYMRRKVTEKHGIHEHLTITIIHSYGFKLDTFRTETQVIWVLTVVCVPSTIVSGHRGKLENPDQFDFQRELRHANNEGTLPKDVAVELEKLVSADLLILQFPMYWMNLPAILKGWLDRCFTEQVCFDTANGTWFDHGPFTAKKAMLSFTTGGTASYFSKRGLFGDMEVLLWPIHNTLRFCGFQVLPPHILHAPNDVSMEERQKMLSDWSTRLSSIFAEKPLNFVHIENFDVEDGFQLSHSYMEQAEQLKFGPTAGQNLGKPFKSVVKDKKLNQLSRTTSDDEAS